MPLGSRLTKRESGFWIVRSRRNIQRSSSDSSSISSNVQFASSPGRHQSELTLVLGVSPSRKRVSKPSLASKISQDDSAGRTFSTSLRKMPTSKSLWGRLCVPTKRSSAQPPATHQGAQSERRYPATSVG